MTRSAPQVPRHVPTLTRPSRGHYRRWVKPLVDRVGGAVLLLLLLPLMAVVALVVLVSLGRPVLLVQQRVGQHGRLLGVLKFRTMRPDRRLAGGAAGPAGTGPGGQERRTAHKRVDDPRHTPVGRILRRWSLDELPQLWHLITGEMSLVGPRPELLEVAVGYGPADLERLDVKPGLTGLWQTTARGLADPMHHHIDIDVTYVRSLSARTDLRILLATLPAITGPHRGR